MTRKLISPWDMVMIGLALAVGILLYFFLRPGDTPGLTARITVRGYPDMYVDLGVDQEFHLPQNPHVLFQVVDGSISFSKSDCPDQVCIRMGPQSRVGQSAACLPNRVSILILGEADGIDLFM